MYKKQMILQRITSYLLLAASVLVFIYSIGIMTDIHRSFSLASSWKESHRYYFEGAKIYEYMQDFNRELVVASIILILSSVSLFVFRSHDRRKYYIANYITIGVNALTNIGISVWALIQVFSYKSMFVNGIDFAKYEIAAGKYKFQYTPSTQTFWFDISSVVFAVLLIVTAISLFNLFFKIYLMKAERKLLEEGMEA